MEQEYDNTKIDLIVVIIASVLFAFSFGQLINRLLNEIISYQTNSGIISTNS